MAFRMSRERMFFNAVSFEAAGEMLAEGFVPILVRQMAHRHEREMNLLLRDPESQQEFVCVHGDQNMTPVRLTVEQFVTWVGENGYAGEYEIPIIPNDELVTRDTDAAHHFVEVIGT